MNSRQLPPPDGSLTNAIKVLAKFQRQARTRHNYRRKRAEKLGLYSIYDRTIEGQIHALKDAIEMARATVKRIPRLEAARAREEKPEDKTEGRNRLSVAYGKE